MFQFTMKPSIAAIGGFAWVAAVFVGVAAMWAYEKQPGADGRAPRHWAGNPRIQFSPDRPNVVMYAHPKCPCTRAALSQLNSLCATAPESQVTIVFYVPDGADASWRSGKSIEIARSHPTASIVFDPGGETIPALGVTTSGHVVVYRPNGELAFSGGITVSRGHEGPNEGLLALQQAIEGMPGNATYPVYGCTLLSD